MDIGSPDPRATLRPTDAGDATLLRSWFVEDPDMYGYWGGAPLTEEKILEKCAWDHSDGETVRRWIVLEFDAPVGYVQEWHTFAEAAFGFDIVLVPSARGRGIGPEVLAGLAARARSAGMPDAITVDPRADNVPAIRAFEKAGFVPSHDEVTDGVDHLIMRWKE